MQFLCSFQPMVGTADAENLVYLARGADDTGAATREEAIEYYRGVAAQEQLAVRLYERVLQVTGKAGDFVVVTDRMEHRARNDVASATRWTARR